MLMKERPPGATRTDTLFPYATLVRADVVDGPVKGLLDKQYLASRRMLISPFTVRADYPAGSPPGAEPRTASGPVAEHGTTHFVAVDRDGSVASMTRSEEHTSELQSLMRISYAVFCLNTQNLTTN